MTNAKNPSARRAKRRCTMCRVGRLTPGTTTVTLERGEMVLVVKDVPALVCKNCSAGYTGGRATDRVLEIGEGALTRGVRFGLHRYTPKDEKPGHAA